jgi:hypothetical protein
MQELLKVCSKCKQEKTRSCFSNRTNSPDGKQRYCKACAAESSVKCVWNKRARNSGMTLDEYRKALEQKRVEQQQKSQSIQVFKKRNKKPVDTRMFTTRNRRAILGGAV